jgi:hypothetical protein
MIPPQRLPNGKIRVPMRAEAPDGTIGDGMVDLAPGDSGYARWDEYLRAKESSTLRK